MMLGSEKIQQSVVMHFFNQVSRRSQEISLKERRSNDCKRPNTKLEVLRLHKSCPLVANGAYASGRGLQFIRCNVTVAADG